MCKQDSKWLGIIGFLVLGLMFLGGATRIVTAEPNAIPYMESWQHDRILIGAYKLSYPDSTPIEKLKQEINNLQSLGFDFAYFDVWGVPRAEPLQPLLDYADEQGFSLVPHINVCFSPLRELNDLGQAQWKSTPKDAIPPPGEKPYIFGIGEDMWAQRWRDGSIVYEGAWRGHPFPYPDMWAPEARRSFREAVRDTAELLASYTSVRLVSWDDEYRYWFDFMGDRGIPIFSPWSQQIVSLAPGEASVPEGEPPTPGYIAGKGDDFIGVRYTTGYQFYDFTDPSLDFHVSDLSRVLNDHVRGLGDFFTTGAYGADSAWVMARAYATERNDPPLADDFSLAFAERKAKDHAEFAVLLGWWQDHLNTSFYNRRLLLATRLAMLHGPRSIVFAPTNTLTQEPAYRSTLSELIDEIGAIGPLFRHIQIKQSRVGLLWSDTTLSYQQLGESNWRDSPEGSPDRNWRWEEHKLSAHIIYAAMCQAGIRPRIVTERDVLDGVLSELDVLVMANHQYSETRLVREYEKFVTQGGLVIADQSSAVTPQQALVLASDASLWCRMMEEGKRDWWSRDLSAHLNTYRAAQGLIDAMSQEIRDVLPSQYTRSFIKDAANRLFVVMARGAGIDYLVMLNSDLEESITSDLLIDHRGPVYDLTSSGRRVDVENPFEESDGQWRVSLDPAGWAVWLLADRPLDVIKAVLVTGDVPAVIRCQLWDDEGFPMKGVIPFSVRWGDHVFHGVAEHGVGTIWIPETIAPDEQIEVEALGMTACIAMMPTKDR